MIKFQFKFNFHKKYISRFTFFNPKTQKYPKIERWLHTPARNARSPAKRNRHSSQRITSYPLIGIQFDANFNHCEGNRTSPFQTSTLPLNKHPHTHTTVMEFCFNERILQQWKEKSFTPPPPLPKHHRTDKKLSPHSVDLIKVFPFPKC